MITHNPFVSEAQRRACYAKGDPDWDCAEWQAATGKKKLPKRKKQTTKNLLNIMRRKRMALNRFCSTGPGGGVDPTCGKGDGGNRSVEDDRGSKDNPIKCGDDIKKAARLLAQGKHVQLSQPDQVATLVNKMAKMINKAIEKGEVPPHFDLCKVSVPRTNLFCEETLGIPRVKMPQMRGIPEPGSYAATLPAGKKSGKVDLSADFIKHLADQGIKSERTEIRASHLRASQGEIVGSRVVQLVTETKAGDRDLREKPIFVTRDNYIVDGHHHWAADVVMSAEKGKDWKIPVYKLDMDIGKALTMANDFTKAAGLKPKSGTAPATTNQRIRINARRINPLRIDPTRTTLLRKKMIDGIRKKFARIKMNLFNLTVKEDAFGLKKATENANPNHDEKGRFASADVPALQKQVDDARTLEPSEYGHIKERAKGRAPFMTPPIPFEWSQELEDKVRDSIQNGKATIRQVPVKSLISLQKVVSKSSVKYMLANRDDPNIEHQITVVRIGGKNYIHDGTHRTTAAKMLGEKTIKAKVFSLPAHNMNPNHDGQGRFSSGDGSSNPKDWSDGERHNIQIPNAGELYVTKNPSGSWIRDRMSVIKPVKGSKTLKREMKGVAIGKDMYLFSAEDAHHEDVFSLITGKDPEEIYKERNGANRFVIRKVEDKEPEILHYGEEGDPTAEISTYAKRTGIQVTNRFCPTGAGGGVDASCGNDSESKPSLAGRLKGKIVNVFKGLRRDYGLGGTIAIGAAMLALMPVPVPGTSLAPIYAAKAIKKIIGKFKKEAPAVALNFDAREIALKLLREIFAEAGEEYKQPPVANAGRFAFHSDPEKLAAFQQWLKEQFKANLTGKTEDQLWQIYIEQGYRRGAGRAFDDVKGRRWGAGEGEFYKGSKEQFLKDSFARPVDVEKVKLLADRAFDELENVTSDMSNKMSRVLTDGLVEGKGPHEVAREMADEVDISRARAETIARTELIRAHAEGQLTAMENLGVEEVGAAIEWSTTGDSKVCEDCAALQGVVLKIDEARGMLPQHPNCRCAWIPANVGESEEGQKRTKTEIEDAFEEAGDPEKEIDKDRPESIVNSLFEAVLNFDRLLEVE